MVLVKKFLICLAGLPASGKSTFSNTLKESIEKKYPIIKVKIVDPDILREQIMGETFQPEKEELVRKANLTAISNSLQNGYAVISDDLNYYASMRHDLKDIAQKYEVPFFIVHISTPLEICLKWNDKRSNPIPNKVIYEVKEKFDYFNKYKWDEPDAVYNLAEYVEIENAAENFLQYLEKSVELKKKQKDKSKETRTEDQSYHESLDKITREVVGKFLKQEIYQDKKGEILECRKKYLKQELDSQMKKQEIRDDFSSYLKKALDI
ncbi:MAG: L-seryl-tRNA(Sec) kinase [Promethearchaeota archaeon]|nr:MAG: L-seryl-tRNA(Sec) kinase [Candidatus Lokiarchaeota archaeon]